MQLLPLSIHLAFCRFGSRYASKRESANPCERAKSEARTVREYAASITAYVVVACAIDPQTTFAPVESGFTAEALRAYGDVLHARIGPDRARKRLSKLGSATTAITGSSIPAIADEISRLAGLPKIERTPRPKLWPLPVDEIPEALEFLFFRIATKVHVSADGNPVHDYASRQSMHVRARQYLASLKALGIDLADVTEDTLVTEDRLESYLLWYQTKDQVGLLYSLKSAIDGLGGEAFRAVLAVRGVSEQVLNRDYENFVPEDDRRRLEAALTRAASERMTDEPASLSTAVADKLRRTYGGWHRCLAGTSLSGIPIPDLDLMAALHSYESQNTGLETMTLVARLSEVKAVVSRIAFEDHRDGLAALHESHKTLPDVLNYRIRELKRSVARLPVSLPEDLTPRDIERLGRILVSGAWQRLKGLVATKYCYCGLRRFAERFRDGMILILFSAICLRVGDMSRLIYDGTIFETNGIWGVDFTSKNGENIHQNFAPWIGSLCHFYFHEIRRLIAPISEGRNDEVWWMSRYGRPLNVTAFQENIPRYIAEHYGVKVNVHKLRALEASFARVEFHEDSSVGSTLLRHKAKGSASYYVSQRATDAAKKKLAALAFTDTLVPIDFDHL